MGIEPAYRFHRTIIERIRSGKPMSVWAAALIARLLAPRISRKPWPGFSSIPGHVKSTIIPQARLFKGTETEKRNE